MEVGGYRKGGRYTRPKTEKEVALKERNSLLRHRRRKLLEQISRQRVPQPPGDRHRCLAVVFHVSGGSEEPKGAFVGAESREQHDGRAHPLVVLTSLPRLAFGHRRVLALPMHSLAADGVGDSQLLLDDVEIIGELLKDVGERLGEERFVETSGLHRIRHSTGTFQRLLCATQRRLRGDVHVGDSVLRSA